ncbi:response regulator transcription factor [Oceanicella sp. SM1341]|uniref:response regulator transcription factor n=1 Tax=Oceanicella sp. SM1341 TaxID=1548889 RepID=UPI000E4874CB|nr:response regulator transcription factor [Oceanicella sp. SM1341]
MRVLLLEDTSDVAEAIVASLARRGAAVDHADTLARARDALAVQDYDVAILDINLPDGSGTELLREMRGARNATPVLMLTARIEVEDRIAALDTGADDYLVKPFDLRELEARVRALARRATPDRGGEIAFGDLAFDPAGRTLSVSGRPVALTRRELSLFEVLIANRGRVMSKERIFERMFPFDEEEVGLTAIEIYVARVRRKIEGSRVSIRTLRGLGYQLVADE